jgi:hypothetical protein
MPPFREHAVIESYPQMRRRLRFIRFCQWARSVSDRCGLVPSTGGRLCFLLILAAAWFGVSLALSLAFKITADIGLSAALAMLSLVLVAGSTLLLWGSDKDLACRRAQLIKALPAAKIAWDQERVQYRLEPRTGGESSYTAKIDRPAAEQPRTDRSRPRPSGAVATVSIKGPGTFQVQVVGVLNYQGVLAEICGREIGKGAYFKTTALLVLENNHPSDSDAVRVEIDNQVVGYLGHLNARKYRAHLESIGQPAAIASCKAVIVGGRDRGSEEYGHFGIRLDLPTD